jgi:riboflavin biosynthesis pyrimidine reductase
MHGELLQLYPLPNLSLPLARLYLHHPLHRIADAAEPLVYANFVTSLDGRIALPRAGRASHGVPPAIGNSRDWRLYQELAAQSDLLVTSARYFRQFESGEAQDNLPIGPGERFADLRQWRLDQGFNAQPDVAIFSASLDIPASALKTYAERRLHVLTGADADPARVDGLRAAGAEVHLAGIGTNANGAQALDALKGLGYRRIYVVAGPTVFHTLVCAGAVQRLYLTFAHRLLGGEDFDTLTWGSELHPAPKLALRSLFYDAAAPEGAGQLLSCYDIVPDTGA